MTKGFAPIVASAKLKNIKTQHQPISMQELEGGLLSYLMIAQIQELTVLNLTYLKIF